MRRAVAGLAILMAGCGSSEPASSPVGPAAIDTTKVAVEAGWLRFKGARAAEEQSTYIIVGATEYLFTDGKNSFKVAKSDFRSDQQAGYAEIRFGAKLSFDEVEPVSDPAWDSTFVTPAAAAQCGGGPTACIPVWLGCGPLVCGDSRELIGACCGGWTADTAP